MSLVSSFLMNLINSNALILTNGLESKFSYNKFPVLQNHLVRKLGHRTILFHFLDIMVLYSAKTFPTANFSKQNATKYFVIIHVCIRYEKDKNEDMAIKYKFPIGLIVLFLFFLYLIARIWVISRNSVCLATVSTLFEAHSWLESHP